MIILDQGFYSLKFFWKISFRVLLQTSPDISFIYQDNVSVPPIKYNGEKLEMSLCPVFLNICIVKKNMI